MIEIIKEKKENIMVNKGKHLFGICKVNEKGQIVIPKEARKIFKIESGDSLILVGDEKKGLALVKAEVISEFTDSIIK